MKLDVHSRVAKVVAAAVLGLVVGVPLIATGKQPSGAADMASGAAAGPGGAPGESDDAARWSRRPRIAGLHCAEAARIEVEVPADGVDEIRVAVAPAAPGAASQVTVLGARSDRSLRVGGSGTWGVALTSPIAGDRLLVAVEPALDAGTGACVDRVELLRAGVVVAVARPQ